MITRDAAHNYYYEGRQYPGVTGILGVLDKSGALMGWAARQTAEAALNLYADNVTNGDTALKHLMDTVGREGTIRALTSRSSWTRDEAAQLGTDVHRLADLVVRGEPTPPMVEGIRHRVLAYAEWWKVSGWRLRLSEAMVIRPTDSEGTEPGWGGTFDLLAYDADGKTVLADIKTGKAVYREAVLQLAAYGMASKVQPAVDNAITQREAVYTMPVPDRYVILHVTLDGVREVEVNIGTPERMAFLACLDLWHWTESMKGKKL
jgi:hypothetical protein